MRVVDVDRSVGDVVDIESRHIVLFTVRRSSDSRNRGPRICDWVCGHIIRGNEILLANTDLLAPDRLVVIGSRGHDFILAVLIAALRYIREESRREF